MAVLLALAWTATAPRAMAQDYSWNNTADGNWSESNDWTPSNNTPPYPDSTNAAVTVPTSSGYTISITNGTDTINSLTATGTGYVTISGGTLVMDGTTPTIDAGVSNTVTIDSTLQLNETTTITQGEDTLNLGTVTGPGGLIIDTTGGLTVGITSAASYTGATTLEASGQLGLPGGTAASSGFDLTTSSVYLGIAGNETINNLSGSGGYVDIYGYTFTVVNTTNNTFAGTINGDGGSLVVNSTNDSTLVLSGDNTYTGGTTVSGGILEISSQSNIGAGGLTLGGGEMLTSTNATFTENVTLNSGTNDTLAAVTDTTATYNGIISGSNALTINDGVNDGTVVLTTNNTYTGGTTISAGVLQANTNNALGTGAVTVDSGASLQLNGGITLGTNNNIIISGTGAGGAGAIFSNDGDTDNVDGTVTLANSASIVGSGDNTALALNGSISLSSNDLTLEATNGSQIGLYGQITGSGGITVTTNEGFEHGVDLLGSTSNTYTGTTTVENGGALDLDKSSNVTAISGNLEIDGGEVWDFSTGQLAASSVLTLTSNGLFIFVGSGPQTETIAGLNGDSGTEIATGLNVPVTLILNETGNYNYAGNIEDTYLTISLVKEGAGTQILSGTNDYAGGTTINGGILEISSENNIGGTNAGGLTLGGGELLTSSNATFSENVTLNSGTNDTLAAVTDTTATYNGIISGSNALTINDGTNDGTVALNGNNIYTGGTTIESGTVIVGTNNAFGTGTVFTIDPTITYTNSVTVTNPIDMMGDTTLEVDSSNSATQAGVISGTDTDVLTKAGTGTLILSATNTYTGATVISAGTLAMGTNGSIASSSEVDLTNSGTTFDISNGGSQTIQNLTGVSGSTVNLGANNLAEGTVDSTEFDGVIEGAGGSLTVQGGGLLILTGSNTYTGGTTIDAASYLVAENSNALGSGAVTLSGNGTLEGGPGVTVTNAINLGSGGGNIGNFGAYAQTTFSGAIALNSNNLTIFSYSDVPASTTLSGGITGTGNLTLISDNSASVILSGASVNNTGTITNEGTGTSGTTISAAIGSSVTGVIQDSATSSLTLTHANTYAGGTTVTTGDLIVGNASALGTGSVAVNGGTLTTTGLGIGIQIAMDGNYNQGANGTLALNLYSSTNYDSLNLTSSTGVATVDGTLELNLVGGFAPGSGEKFAVITTSNQVEGAFTTVTTSQPTIGFTVDYTDDVTVLFQEPFATLPGADLNPNQLSVARYIDQHDLTSTNPGFNSLVAALNGLSGNPGAFGGYLDQLTSLNFANFAGSTAFNNASFWTQAFDSYLANHRGADGTFVSSAGGIDDSGLSVNDPNYDPGLQ
ncbi:MAG: autotransporter-associated beta strand repeat-containing protein, partial [Methylacidiphilales bacterium]|nr:autotransporter-associated beta strand repeat-containing protein [Candidatus Methylacidiphilales bacterium]